MSPLTFTKPIDIIVQLLSTCPVEIVEHIFSFTSREHASAAGLFDFAVKIPPLEEVVIEKITNCYPAELTPLQHALQSGDLPLLRHLLPSGYGHPDVMFPVIFPEITANGGCMFANVEQHNLHTYMYLYTLFDVASSTDTRYVHHKACFNMIRLWATREARFDILEWLQRSKLARQTRPAFLDWNMLCYSYCRRLELVEYVYEHERFNEMEDQPDYILWLALNCNWYDALRYLHDRGVRFTTWGHEVLDVIYTKRVTFDGWEVWPTDRPLWVHPMHTLRMFPEDMCAECRERWLPRIGWWGMVSVYETHGDPTRSMHGVTDGDDQAARAVLNDRLLICPSSQQNLLNAFHEAIRDRDTGVLDYVARVLPEYQPILPIAYVAIRSNDVDVLRTCIDRYPDVVEEIDVFHVRPEIVRYYNYYKLRRCVEVKSTVKVIRLLDAFLRERGKRILILSKRVLERAALAGDVMFLEWAWSNLTQIPHLKKKPR